MTDDRGTTNRSARVRFLTAGESGRGSPAMPGLRSQLDLGDSHTTCIIDDDSGRGVFPAGVEIEVQIQILFPWVTNEFRALRSVRLYEGSKLVATGYFLDQSKFVD